MDEETLTSELNEVGMKVVALASRVRQASMISKDSEIATRTEVDLAIQLNANIERLLKEIKKTWLNNGS